MKRKSLQIEENKESLVLVVCDVMLPEHTGPELMKTALAIIPNLKVLYLSGYTEKMVVQQEILQKDSNFLEKPFAISQLLEKVNRTLNDL